jgi:hypothetical protein
MPSALFALDVASHLVEHFLGVLEPLHQLPILALHDVSQGVLGLFLVLIGVEQLLGDRVDEELALVDENDLDRLVVQPEYDGVLRPEPPPDVYQILLVDVCGTSC